VTRVRFWTMPAARPGAAGIPGRPRPCRTLDGRNRLLACEKAKVEPTFVTHDGDDASALALVISLNVQSGTSPPGSGPLPRRRLGWLAARGSRVRNRYRLYRTP